MTKKIAISIPDDVAERLAAGDIDNVSAYVTEALRRQIAVEKTRQMLEDAGIHVTQEGVERWRRILREKDAQRRPGMWDAFDERMERLRRGEAL